MLSSVWSYTRYKLQTHIYLCLLLFCGIHNGGAAHLSNLTALAIKGPTTDLITNHIFDEEDTTVESQ